MPLRTVHNVTSAKRTRVDPAIRAKVMLIGDDKAMAETLETMLVEVGYTNLVTCAEPAKALSTMHQQRPDLLLLSLNMRGTPGIDILAEVRADSELEHLPIIAIGGADQQTRGKAFDLGVNDYLVDQPDTYELKLRLGNTLSANAYRDQIAYHDSLTGLPNRRLFFQRLEALLSASDRKHPCAVLHIDVDGFKKINDSLGLQVGDAVLRETATRFARHVRQPKFESFFGFGEFPPMLARVGSDEFTVLLPRVDNMADAGSTARALLREMEPPFHAGKQELFVSVSIGIADGAVGGQDADTLLKQADVAMAHAKREGQSHYNFYSRDLNANSLRHLSLSNDLRRAIERRELYPLFQPKLDAVSRKVVGAEALLRWKHPLLGEISPDVFMHLAEETDQIVSIGSWMLAAGCARARRMHAEGWPSFNVAVNVASKQFRHPGFTKLVAQVLERTDLNPEHLTLELVESTVMDSGAGSIETLHRLDQMGVKLSLDDFGTGYSSLAYLRKFPIHELKIDRSFIIELGKRDDDQAIVAAIVAMAHALGMRVVAEGVESDVQVNFLRGIDCDLLQGYRYSHPVPGPDLADAIRELDGELRLPSRQS